MDDTQPSSGDIASPSFAEAFASDEPDQTAAASPAPQPDDSTPPPPDATVPGEPSDSPASDTGPIPYERHKAILEGERQRAVDLQSRYAWVPQGLDPSQGAAMVQWFTRAAQDPVGFIRQLEQELQAHPQFGQQLQRAAQPQTDEELVPALTAENGEPVYSAKQQRELRESDERRLQAFIEQRLRPLLEERQQQQIHSAATERVTEQLQEARTWEAFEDLRGDIADLMQRDGRVTLQSAYLRLLQEKYLPSLKSRERASVLAELSGKAQASTINPGKSAGTSPKNYQVEGFEAALRDSG